MSRVSKQIYKAGSLPVATIADILAKISNSDEEYFNGAGKGFLSKSSCGALLGDVREFLLPKQDNINFELGSYFHHLLIEPDKATLDHVVKSSTRTTKVYKQYCADNNIPFAVLESEKDNIELCAKAMQALVEFNNLIFSMDAEYEVAGITDFGGLMWKGKADIITNDLVVDLKTTGDISRFARSAYAFNYDVQAFIYRKIFGKEMLFLAVCKKTATCGWFTCSEEFYSSGERKAQRAVEVYNEYFGENATKDPQKYFITKTL